MTTRIETTDGRPLIDSLDYLPSPRERVEKDGKQYIITDDVPVTKMVQVVPGKSQYMRVVTARLAESEKKTKQTSSGGRGPVVEG